MQPYKLAVGADVFVESYRTRKISNLGLSTRGAGRPPPGHRLRFCALLRLRRAVANRAGFDMEGLCVTGFTTEEGTLDRPAFPPTQSGVLFDQRQKSLVQMTSVNVYPF